MGQSKDPGRAVHVEGLRWFRSNLDKGLGEIG